MNYIKIYLKYNNHNYIISMNVSRNIVTLIIEFMLPKGDDKNWKKSQWLELSLTLRQMSCLSKNFRLACINDDIWFIIARGIWPRHVGNEFGSVGDA